MTPLFSIFYRSWSVSLRESARHYTNYGTNGRFGRAARPLARPDIKWDIFLFVSELRRKPKICSDDAPGLVRGLLWRHLKLPLQCYNEIWRGPVRSPFVVVCSVKRILCKWNICHTRLLRQVFLFRGACFYARSCDFINVLGLAHRSRYRHDETTNRASDRLSSVKSQFLSPVYGRSGTRSRSGISAYRSHLQLGRYREYYELVQCPKCKCVTFTVNLPHEIFSDTALLRLSS